MGLIDDDLKQIKNIYWQTFSIGKKARAQLKNQKPVVLWFTGLSASGKTTIANLLEEYLHARDRHTFLLDGDNIRHGLNKDLSFTDPDRVENIRRIAEISKLMVEAGLIVIASFISPFYTDRRMARGLMEEGEFIEIYINASIELCASRDPKGLYKKAQNGQIKNFTGIDSGYDIPKRPEIIIDSSNTEAIDAANQILLYLESNNYLDVLDDQI
ncbi:MAG TPA: adenylyl-sulfate kinase [Rhodospirillales bacterium]|nr:adenylyl-sulfate kinase [Rhodospirillales bacterium]